MLLSVIAMYNYDNTLFEDLEDCLPSSPSNSEYAVENYTPIDFQTMVNLIMLRAGEMSLVYSQPSLLKWSIGVWAKTQKGKWQALFDTLWYRYDPMFSKIRSYALDRNTTHNADTTDDLTGKDTNNVTRTDKTVTDKDSTSKKIFAETSKTDDDLTGSYSNTENATTDDDVSGSYSDTKSGTNNETVNLTDTTYVQAFNDVGSNNWHEKDKVTHTGTDNYTTGENGSGTNSSERDVTTNTTGSGNNSSQRDITSKIDNTTNITDTDDIITDFTQTISDILDKKVNRAIKLIDKGTVKDIITETIQGQAPFQELIKLQREIAEFNLYNYIADDFVANFCVMVY